MSENNNAIHSDKNNNKSQYIVVKLLTDDEFYNIVNHCIMCQKQCTKNELQAYLGTCYNCHIDDIMANYSSSDDNSSNDADDDDDDELDYNYIPRRLPI